MVRGTDKGRRRFWRLFLRTYTGRTFEKLRKSIAFARKFLYNIIKYKRENHWTINSEHTYQKRGFGNSAEIREMLIDGKEIRLDVYVDGENEVYNIEMQTSVNPNLAKMARYYQGVNDVHMLKKAAYYK